MNKQLQSRNGAFFVRLLLATLFIASVIWWRTNSTDAPNTEHQDITQASTLKNKPATQSTFIPNPYPKKDTVSNAPTVNKNTIETSTITSQTGNDLNADLAPWEVAKTTPSDEEFYRVVELMRNDPSFLAGILQEFQSENNPKRLRWLAFMLGDLKDHPELTALAGQMLFSGVETSETAALVLLGRIQKRDPTARDLVLQALGSRQEPEFLIPAMNAIALPSTDISLAQKQQIINQLSPLTQHNHAIVRSHSYSLLFRWVSEEPYMAQQLSDGLRDSNAKVRRSTIVGFIEHPQKDEVIKLRLMDILNDTEESKQNRNLAGRALNKLALNQDEIAHVRAMTRAMR